MRTGRGVFVIWVLGILVLPTQALGSRAGMDGSGLPRLLTVDPSLVRLLPGSTTRFKPGLVIDASSSSSSFVQRIGLTNFSDEDDRFAMILAGDKLRYGYVLDGRIHSLVLGTPSGVGVSLSFADRFTKSEDFERDEPPPGGVETVSLDEVEISRRGVRLGVGWQGTKASGRVFEIATAASYLDVDVTGRGLYITSDESGEAMASWRSDPGWGLDVTFRSVSEGPGLQIGGHLAYEDLNPDSSTVSLSSKRRAGSIQVGISMDNEYLDRLVVGLTSRWTDEEMPYLSIYRDRLTARTERETRYMGGVFVSAEKKLKNRFVARAGVHALGTFFENTRNESSFDGPVLDRTNRRTNSSGSIEPAAVYLGVGWSWKKLLLEARIRGDLTLWNPIVRWAATVEF